MSTRVVHSRTSKTSARGRGRGRAGQALSEHGSRSSPYSGAASHHSHTSPRSTYPDAQEDEHSSSMSEELTASVPRGQERTLESRGTHYVLSPDPSKNSKLKSTARHEEQQYVRHKEEKRERVTDMLSQQNPEVVGGPSYSRSDLKELRVKQEKQQQMEAKFAAVRTRQKREEYQRNERQREDEELKKMKQTQREKAVRLEEKKKVQDQVDLEDLRRKRLARFDST